MDSFIRFFKDIRVSFIVALVFFIVYTVVALDGYYGDKLQSEVRVRFYHVFLHTETPDPNKTLGTEFVRLLRELSSVSIEEKPATWLLAYGELREKEFASLHGFFTALHWEERLGLVRGDTSVVDALAKKEREYQKTISDAFSWFQGWFSTLIVWQIVSIISFLCYWWRDSFIMSYVPYRAWWFWIYSVITLPWSIVLWMMIIFSHVRYKFQSAMLSRWNSGHREYKQKISDIAGQIDDTRRQWMELFPSDFKRKEIERLRRLIPDLRQEADALGDQLEKAQERYFLAKARLDLVNGKTDGDDSVVGMMEKEAWNNEFERILSCPDIRAISVDGCGAIEFFTDTFQTSLGGVGPFVITINLVRESYDASVYHHSSMQASTGLRHGRTFCFGNMDQVIRGLVRDHKISEAVNVMIHSFQTNGPE